MNLSKGIYVGVDEIEELTPFTSSPAPSSWTTSGSDYSSASATNYLGTWALSCPQGVSASSTRIQYGFDSDTSTYTRTANMSSGTTTVSFELTLPDGLSINPTSIHVIYAYWGATRKIQGYNKTTGTWVDIALLSTTGTSVTEETLTISQNTYFTKFRVYGQVHSSTYKFAALYHFKITSGTIKKGNAQSNVAHKVTKAYVGVDNKARKIKKGYIGVGGVARLFYSTEN